MHMDARATTEPPWMPDSPPNPQLLSALGRLVRGLSAVFWGLPIALVVCVQTAKTDWLRSLGVAPPLIALGLVYYGINLLGEFQKQERVWHSALDRARLLAVVNFGLSPFLYWWNRLPGNPFYGAIVELMFVTSVLFLFTLNLTLRRLTAMLPDETLRLETRLFTTVNGYLLMITLVLTSAYFVFARMEGFEQLALRALAVLDRAGIWVLVFAILIPMLLPVAMTMALVWKVKEVILASVFGSATDE
jgi:hypothetical protein